MTIRTRLVLWYSLILLFGLLLIAACGYYEMVIAHPEVKRALATQGHTPLQELLEVLLVGGMPALMLAVVGGWFLMHRALLPVATLTHAVERVQATTLDQRLPRSGNCDELDRLTVVVNAMMERLEDSFSRVREFTLHASHELKTPLTVMRAEMESALRSGRCDEAQLDLLANQLDEVQRLTQIIDSLAFLAKADVGQIALKCDPVPFHELVKDSFEDAQILARPQNITVELTGCEEIIVRGDRHRLRQLLLNLTDNAIKHNWSQGRVSIALRRNERPAAELRIDNTGPGIAPEKLPRVFDRFFRGEISHTGAIEGTGLGLSIAQWIVHAHGGSIKIASQPGTLTSIIVHFPS